MNKKSIITAVSAAILMSNVYAAETKKAKTVSSKTMTASKKANVAARNVIPSTQVYRAKQSDSISTQRSSATRAVLPMGGTTATTAAAVQPPMAKKSPFSIGANFYYYGSSLQEPFRSYKSDIDGGEGYTGGPVSLETHLIFGYKLNSNMTVSLNPYFESYANYRKYNPGTGGYDAVEGSPFALTSPFARLAFGKFVQSGNFKWNGDFRVYPGVGAAMHSLPIYLRNGHNFFYTLTPKLSLAAYNTIRYYRYTNAAYNDNASKRNLRVTAAPAVEYQARDNLGLSVSYNMDIQHAHTKTWSPLHWDHPFTSYFEAGISWDASKRINITPYVDIYARKLKAYNNLLGVNLAISIL